MVKDSAQIIQLENANLRQRILTPITSIYSQIDDLKEVLATDTQSLADLDKVSNGCDRLKSLTNALMDSGGISSSKSDAELSKIRHDLKNPLNSIIGYAEIISEETADSLSAADLKLLQHLIELGNEISASIDSAFLSSSAREEAGDAMSGEAEAISKLFASLEETTIKMEIGHEIAGSTILIVDDNKTNQDILLRRLRANGFNCLLADGGNEALDTVKAQAVDLVLLDLLMPDKNGIEVLHEMRAMPETRDIPIIIVSGLNDPRGIAKCISHGASDYLSKPVEPLILDAKVISALERFAYRRELNILATTDQLTELKNRRASMARLEEIRLAAEESDSNFGVMLIDIDFFKKVNDTHGHPGGDQVLRDFSKMLESVTRASDLVGRMGGEEFLVAIPNSSFDDFKLVCERVRSSIQSMECFFEGTKIEVTTSGGTYFSEEGRKQISEMINIADERLYKAKDGGRNQIIHND
jgi:diguanylate cyclase (GGDEF)-like protein